MFEIIGYDKDGDSFISFGTKENLESATLEAESMLEKLSQDELRNPDTNEPVDWLEIVDANDWTKIHWTSY